MINKPRHLSVLLLIVGLIVGILVGVGLRSGYQAFQEASPAGTSNQTPTLEGTNCNQFTSTFGGCSSYGPTAEGYMKYFIDQAVQQFLDQSGVSVPQPSSCCEQVTVTATMEIDEYHANSDVTTAPEFFTRLVITMKSLQIHIIKFVPGTPGQICVPEITDIDVLAQMKKNNKKIPKLLVIRTGTFGATVKPFYNDSDISNDLIGERKVRHSTGCTYHLVMGGIDEKICPNCLKPTATPATTPTSNVTPTIGQNVTPITTPIATPVNN